MTSPNLRWNSANGASLTLECSECHQDVRQSICQYVIKEQDAGIQTAKEQDTDIQTAKEQVYWYNSLLTAKELAIVYFFPI